MAALCSLAAIGGAGCGGGERQDADEQEASFDVEVVDASFPERQRLADTSNLEITVRNDDSETVPNLTATLDGLSYRSREPDLADPERPVFVINGVPKQIGGFPEVKLAAPEGGPTALVNTWTLGPLEPGDEKTFRWRVTAVEQGPFELTYAVSGSLYGKSRAVGAGDAQPRGQLSGTVTARPPASRIAADGVTVVNPRP